MLQNKSESPFITSFIPKLFIIKTPRPFSGLKVGFPLLKNTFLQGKLWQYLQNMSSRHKKRGDGFHFHRPKNKRRHFLSMQTTVQIFLYPVNRFGSYKNIPERSRRNGMIKNEPKRPRCCPDLRKIHHCTSTIRVHDTLLLASRMRRNLDSSPAKTTTYPRVYYTPNSIFRQYQNKTPRLGNQKRLLQNPVKIHIVENRFLNVSVREQFIR